MAIQGGILIVRKKSLLSDTVINNKILVFILFILEIPCFLVSGKIAFILNFVAHSSDWEIIPNLYIVCIDFVIHLIFYLFFRCVTKKKVHAPIIV
ncbi:MAG: hypothetical protein LBT88_01010, partial [Oscillospiraceae bacterium]|nr:hypothetical protein [Oscillospiraceae bacterium]